MPPAIDSSAPWRDYGLLQFGNIGATSKPLHDSIKFEHTQDTADSSVDSDHQAVGDSPRVSAEAPSAGGSGGSGSGDTNNPAAASAAMRDKASDDTVMDRIWQNAHRFLNTSPQTAQESQKLTAGKELLQRNLQAITNMMGQACPTCQPRDLSDDTQSLNVTSKFGGTNEGAGGFTAESLVSTCLSLTTERPRSPDDRQRVVSKEDALPTEEIEVQPNHRVQVNLPPTHAPPPPTVSPEAAVIPATVLPKVQSAEKPKKKEIAPFAEFEVKSEDAADLERSISELTMRSSYNAEHSLSKLPDNRRMAYYAVGKHHRQSGRGGNRRCYFTGKLILGGAPFYAGCVQQGLRTLVVFCLPSALGLPQREDIQHYKAMKQLNKVNSTAATTALAAPTSSREQSRSNGTRSNKTGSGLLRLRKLSTGNATFNGSSSIASKSMLSRLSSLDDLSLSIDGDLDPNWGLDRDWLVKILPAADDDVLEQMSLLYPEQFVTLPVQVRDARMWKLYVKFCFFSGLPISEGEMHYKVQDSIAQEVYGEEIPLSHEVMEAVNGASADILMLPNIKTFRYLKKHYGQQCGKLADKVFQRSSWERVAPEV